MNNQHAYLIVLNGNYQSFPSFMNHFGGLSDKLRINDNTWIGYSDIGLNDWYQGMTASQTAPSASGQVDIPIVVPIDLNSIQGLTNQLPGVFRNFLNRSNIKAA